MFVKGLGFGSELALFAEMVCAQVPLARPFSPRCGRRR
jgi:hypothetical protein